MLVNMVPRKKLTAAARRAQLIEVGRAVFAERGYEAASVEEIAERAKVSKPLLYQHFGGKEGLYAVIVDREIEAVVAFIAEAISEGTPRERVDKAVVAFLSYVRDQREGFAILTLDAPAATRGGNLSSLLNEVADRVSDVFVRTLKDAGYSAKGAPIYAHALVGMVTFVGQWWGDQRRPPVDKVASHLSALAWMGLRHLPKSPDPVGKAKRRKRRKEPEATSG